MQHLHGVQLANEVVAVQQHDEDAEVMVELMIDNVDEFLAQFQQEPEAALNRGRGVRGRGRGRGRGGLEPPVAVMVQVIGNEVIAHDRFGNLIHGYVPPRTRRPVGRPPGPRRLVGPGRPNNLPLPAVEVDPAMYAAELRAAQDEQYQDEPIMANVSFIVCQGRRASRATICGHSLCLPCYDRLIVDGRAAFNGLPQAFNAATMPCPGCRGPMGAVRRLHLNG